MAEIAVVGGGPAGLTVAWRAARQGHDVMLLEAGEQLGGMAASIEVGGQRVDLGSHRLHPAAAPHVLAALEGLLGDDLQVRTRHGRLHLRDRWIGFPLRTTELVRRLPPSFAAASLRDTITSPFRHPPDPGTSADTFAAVVDRGLGPTMLREFYGPYARKLWGLPAEELSGELARRRIAASSPAAMVRKLLRGARSEGRTFLYPRLGYGQIVEVLADAAVAAGVRVEVGRQVSFLAPGQQKVTVGVAAGPTIDAQHVVWTAPITSLIRCVGEAPQVVTDGARQLRHRAMTLVYLVLAQDRYTEFDAHYVPDAHIAISRLSEPKNYRCGPDPHGTTVLCAEVPCAIGDEWWEAGPGEAGTRVADELSCLGLPLAAPVDVAVHRLPAVYPIYDRGAVAALAEVDSWAQSLAGVTVLGRQGLFVADNLHHVVDMGWSLADALTTDGAVDAARWAAERARFASFVVED